jgi:predicted ester cyclase
MAAEDRRDVEATLETFTDACWYSVPGLGVELRGKDEIQRWYRDLFTAVPDFRNADERYWVSDSTVFCEARAEGTHLGDWMGWAPTGRRFTSSMLCRIPIAPDGLMEAEVVYLDGADVFRQLGLIPKAGGRQERAMQTIHRARMRLRGR